MHGVALAREHGDGSEAVWMTEPRTLQRLGGEGLALVSHNASFDMAILEWRYGVRPWRIVDTLGLCRMHFPHLRSRQRSTICVSTWACHENQMP